MGNIYSSNSITINKRPNPIPQQVPINYEPLDRVNKFQINTSIHRRLISETYRVSDRNARVPVSKSPLMMEKGVSEVDRYKDFSRTVIKLASYHSKVDSLLSN
jgi:hypothetical protein